MQPITKDIFGNIVDPTKVYQLPKQQKGKGGFLSSLISEAGGATGAAGGAAIGSLFGGVGAIPGAIIGGFLGGTGGKAAEQKIRDNQNFFGAGGSAKSAFGEGALSGALSGAGEAFQLAKLGKTVTGARTLSHPFSNLSAGIAEKQAGRAYSGAIQGIGESLQKGASGYGIGATAKGEQQLTAEGSRAIGQTLKELKIGAGAPETQAKNLGRRLTDLSSQLQNAYSKGTTRLSAQEASNLENNILTKVMGHPDIGPNLSTEGYNAIGRKLELLGTSPTTDQLWKFTKELESKGINFGANSTAKMADREAVNRIFREEIRNTLNNKVKGVADINNLYHRGKTAESFILNAAKDKGGNLTTRGLSLSPVKALESKFGAGTEQFGKILAGTGNPLTMGTNQLVRQSPASLTRAIGGGMQPQDQTQMDQSQGQDIYGQAGGQDMTGMGGMLGGTQQTQQAPQSAYSLEQAMRDLQSTNNPKFQQQIMDRYDFVQKAEAAQRPASMVGKTSAATYGLAQQGMNALGQLNQLILKDPNVISRSATPGRGLPIVGGIITNKAGTGQYDTLGFAAVSSLLRAQSGAAVPDSEVRAYMRNYLPRAGDSPQTVQQKLQTLNFDFQSVLQGGNQSNLSSAIGGQ